MINESKGFQMIILRIITMKILNFILDLLLTGWIDF